MNDAEPFMSMWTVFYDPADRPGLYVARRFDLYRGDTEGRPTADAHTCGTLREARQFIASRAPGLYCIPRQQGDLASVVETWI